MFKYKIYGLNVHSEICLPAIKQNNSNIDVNIYFQNLENFSFRSSLAGNNFKVIEDGVCLFWKNNPLIKISDGNKIIINSSVNIDDNIIRHLILGTAFAVLQHQNGLLVLHASSVNIGNYAIGFLGPTGLGKSTTAFSLNNNGYSIISDDVLPINFSDTSSPIVYPGYPRLRLSSELLEKTDLNMCLKVNESLDKFIVETERFSSVPVPLKRIYVLQRGKNFNIESLSQKNALIEIINNSYCFSILNNLEKSKNLKQCANIVKNISIKRLTIENSLNKLDELVKFIEEDVDNISL